MILEGCRFKSHSSFEWDSIAENQFSNQILAKKGLNLIINVLDAHLNTWVGIHKTSYANS